MLRAAFLLFALAAAPAAADLPQPISAAIAACLAADEGAGLRSGALARAGFVPLGPQDRAEAAAALATVDLIGRMAYGVLQFTDVPLRNAARLAEAVGEAQEAAARDDLRLWFEAPGTPPVYLRIDRLGTGDEAACALSLPPGDWAADIAALLGGKPELRRDEPHLIIQTFAVETGGVGGLTLAQYRPLAFGGIPTRPMLLFPTVTMPE